MRTRKSSIVVISSLIASSLFAVLPAQAATCTATPAGTEGPYYLSGAPVRSNIVETEQGIKTTLTLTVVDSACKAVKGATVDIWHTNASGEYSGVDGNSGIFLRGSQITNTKGQVTFTTIFPGWYPQRTMHIHFKIWRDGQEVLTSQLFATDAITTKIYAMSPYAVRGNQAVNNARDGIYRGYGSSVSLVTMKVTATTKKITAAAKIVI